MRKFWNKKKNRMMILIVLMAAIGVAGIATYAKYYAQSAKNGIAVASGIYFTSNYLGEAANSTDEFKETIVTQEYQGESYTIPLEVRNYENNLLFNEKNMKINYKVTLWLEDGGVIPNGVSYQVSYGDTPTGIGLQVGKENAVTITGEQIVGGKADRKLYQIKIATDSGIRNLTPIPVYAVVETESGSLIQKILKGKLTLKSAPQKDFIESKEFIFPSLEGTPTEAEKLTEALKTGGLTYEIRTVSDALNTSEITEELKVSWDGSVLEINQYDTYYLEAVKSGKTGTDASTGWTYMKIKAMPYAAIELIFFKKDASKITDIGTLNGFVTVEKELN